MRFALYKYKLMSSLPVCRCFPIKKEKLYINTNSYKLAVAMPLLELDEASVRGDDVNWSKIVDKVNSVCHISLPDRSR